MLSSNSLTLGGKKRRLWHWLVRKHTHAHAHRRVSHGEVIYSCFGTTGWRNELYPVYGDVSRPDNVAFVMERAATPVFGISSFGCHLNAYMKESDGTVKMWIARRSKAKQTWPGYLDNCVRNRIPCGQMFKEKCALIINMSVSGRWWHHLQIFYA